MRNICISLVVIADNNVSVCYVYLQVSSARSEAIYTATCTPVQLGTCESIT